MFTDKSIPEDLLKELLPCKIGDRIYTIHKQLKEYPNTYKYELDIMRCEGFIIESYEDLKIVPAENSWDGWCPIYDYGLGYYTDKEEALKKVRELNNIEEFKRHYKWIEDL